MFPNLEKLYFYIYPRKYSGWCAFKNLKNFPKKVNFNKLLHLKVLDVFSSESCASPDVELGSGKGLVDWDYDLSKLTNLEVFKMHGSFASRKTLKINSKNNLNSLWIFEDPKNKNYDFFDNLSNLESFTYGTTISYANTAPRFDDLTKLKNIKELNIDWDHQQDLPFSNFDFPKLRSFQYSSDYINDPDFDWNFHFENAPNLSEIKLDFWWKRSYWKSPFQLPEKANFYFSENNNLKSFSYLNRFSNVKFIPRPRFFCENCSYENEYFKKLKTIVYENNAKSSIFLNDLDNNYLNKLLTRISWKLSTLKIEDNDATILDLTHQPFLKNINFYGHRLRRVNFSSCNQKNELLFKHAGNYIISPYEELELNC